MVLTLIIGLALGGAAVALALRAIALPRIAAASRIGEIQAYGFAGSNTAERDPERRGGVDRVAAARGQGARRPLEPIPGGRDPHPAR